VTNGTGDSSLTSIGCLVLASACDVNARRGAFALTRGVFGVLGGSGSSNVKRMNPIAANAFCSLAFRVLALA